MTETTFAATAAPPGRKGSALKVVAWLLLLAMIVIAWFFLLRAVAPARVDFSRAGGAIAAVFTPPLLLILLCWTGVRRYAAPPGMMAPALATGGVPGPSEPAFLPIARFRVGAWSALTPHGDVAKTLALSKARKAAFKPDKAIVLANGNPAHASMVSDLKLASAGYPASTRLRLPRIATMLTAILDDLNSQQVRLTRAIAGAVNVYWLVPEAIIVDGKLSPDIFAGAWERSAWRDDDYLLHIVPVGRAGAYTVLSVLQNGIDDSLIPYTVVIAADSLLDAEELAPALALEHIFSDSAMHGFIPSEGAAGFLLFNPVKSPQEMWMHAATLAPVKSLALEDGSSRMNNLEGLNSTIASSIHAAAKGNADVNFVISDADHRAEGVIQITKAMTQVVSHLDPLEQRLSPMEYTGSFGAATDVIHLALAMELASAESQVVCSI